MLRRDGYALQLPHASPRHKVNFPVMLLLRTQRRQGRQIPSSSCFLFEIGKANQSNEPRAYSRTVCRIKAVPYQHPSAMCGGSATSSVVVSPGPLGREQVRYDTRLSLT